MSTLKVLRNETHGVVFADQAAPDLTVRFRTTTASKVLNKMPVKNYVTEIVYNDDNNITIAGVSAIDALSLRIRVSGTAESETRLGELLGAVAAQLLTWQSEGVFKGFAPVSAPVIPAV